MRLVEIAHKPAIYVLVGLPGSGKSTWVKKNQAGCVIASSDDYIEMVAKKEGKTYEEVFQNTIASAIDHLNDTVSDALREKNDLIVDQTNLTRKKRMQLLKKVPPEYTKIAVVFTVSDSELEQRLTRRGKETGKVIPPEVINRMRNMYTPPSTDEGFDKIINVGQS